MKVIRITELSDGRTQCDVRSEEGRLLRLVGTLDDVSPERHGDHVMTVNDTMARTAWAFTKAERALASTGSENGDVKQLRKAMKAFESVVEQICELVDRLGTSTQRGWCSSCCENAEHRKVEYGGISTSAYLCGACGSATAPCVAPGCEHFAVRPAGKIRAPRFCAEHTHEIPGFELSEHRIEALEDYAGLFEYQKPNLAKGAKYVAAGVLGAGFAVPAAVAAAPAIGGLIGTALLGLNGAAAGSAGLAMLGGGAVAAGGLGIVGGTYVVTAAGAALGSALGMRFINAYVGEDKSFRIELFRGGTGTPVILARGFNTQGSSDWRGMVELVEKRYPDAPIYKLHWGSKELASLGIVLGAKHAAANGGVRAAAFAAAKASKAAAKKLGPVAPALIAVDVAKNPWHVAKSRADRTGVALAGIIARTDQERFILVGHSLGARVMIVAAQTLSDTPGGPRVDTVHTMGAAVGRNQGWESLSEAVAGTVHNYYSGRDKVLQLAYAIAQGGSRAVGLRGFGANAANIVDHDVTELVGGHSEYVDRIELK
ncbi:TMCO4 family protein [Tsukamurella tyrosinosolvens]|uniref:TMCO4 family protein n=1 Tax=Tsukamurella tyrosinosolvens TaxID=57704 RepID=UPI0021626A07|nr:TMCO4 family protein [Tsukamurella tyrosinosolvens]